MFAPKRRLDRRFGLWYLQQEWTGDEMRWKSGSELLSSVKVEARADEWRSSTASWLHLASPFASLLFLKDPVVHIHFIGPCIESIVVWNLHMATASTFLPLFAVDAVRTPAADRVLGLGELVENILLQLPSAADIVRCRRVSKKFFETVTYSKALRQEIFLDVDAQSERSVNSLAPAWFHQQTNGYRDSTIAARINLLDLWENSGAQPRPLWDRMLISQPPTKTCVIPVGNHVTIYFRRSYPDGMTFGDLERAVIAAFEIRKGRKSSRERLEELSENNSILIYWR